LSGFFIQSTAQAERDPEMTRYSGCTGGELPFPVMSGRKPTFTRWWWDGSDLVNGRVSVIPLSST
jgi:hypothetical protein